MTTFQLQLFTIFLLDGLIIGIIFDIFRIFRKTFQHKDYIIYIQDALFWILTGFIILYTSTIYNDGELRFYMIIATILGFTIYLFTLSSLFIKVSVKIILFIKKVVSTIIKILLIPIKKILGPIRFFVINLKKKKISNKINISKIKEKRRNRQ